ncbi:hypothetical protein NDU88_008301 [Pleurodeles waltl]|uniref:Uncharacterized protein n=1 Tax=Pleurodeles waltl TaxID=8319 RepID=A0AAV7QUA8_PLEWA|nr:hypothetical protein NDU88_008301 [Pleurodeles waltl]
MPQSGSPRDSHLPRCSRAILHALWPGAHHASPKLRGQRSVHAVGHHGHDHPTGGPSIRSRSAEGLVVSSLRVALPGPGPFRRCVPVFKVGVRYTRGPFRQTHRAACRVGATARLPAAGPPFLLLLFTCEDGDGGPHAPPVAVTPSSADSETQGFPRSALQQPPGRRGGAPVSPSAVGWLPLKRRAVPRPAACPLTRSVRFPALTRRQAPGRGARRPSPTGSARLALGSTGARVTHTGPRTRSLSICPGGGAQDNRRSLGPSGVDGSSVRHLWLRGHTPTFRYM